MKDVNMCQGSMCRNEPMKYSPYVAARETTMSRNVSFVEINLRARSQHRRQIPIFQNCTHCEKFSQPAKVCGTARYTVKPAHQSVTMLQKPNSTIAKMYVHLEPWSVRQRPQLAIS